MSDYNYNSSANKQVQFGKNETEIWLLRDPETSTINARKRQQLNRTGKGCKRSYPKQVKKSRHFVTSRRYSSMTENQVE